MDNKALNKAELDDLLNIWENRADSWTIYQSNNKIPVKCKFSNLFQHWKTI